MALQLQKEIEQKIFRTIDWIQMVTKWIPTKVVYNFTHFEIRILSMKQVIRL